MVKENICPLLTTNTVVSEDCKVKIGTQPVFCVRELAHYIEGKNSVDSAIVIERDLYKKLYEQLLDKAV